MSLHGRELERRTGLAAVRVYGRLRSTNARAAIAAERGELPLPAAVVAARQTAGRGQRANRWWADVGSLAVTFMLSASDGPPLTQWPLRAGLAVRAALAGYLPGEELAVKWPNDVLLGGRKIAGVLCEQVHGINLVGIGVNVATDLRDAPAEVRRRAASMSDWLSPAPSRSEVLVGLWVALRQALDDPAWYETFNQWHALAGRTVALATDQGVVRGICRGIDRIGRLRLESADGRLGLHHTGQVVEIS